MRTVWIRLAGDGSHANPNRPDVPPKVSFSCDIPVDAQGRPLLSVARVVVNDDADVHEVAPTDRDRAVTAACHDAVLRGGNTPFADAATARTAFIALAAELGELTAARRTILEEALTLSVAHGLHSQRRGDHRS